MAENKVVNTTQLEADLTSIASAIREKTGGSDSLAFPNGFVSAIDGLATSNNLYFFLDEKFTLVNTLFSDDSAVVFTSDRLKALPDYHALIIEKTTDVSFSNAIYLFLELKLGVGDRSLALTKGSTVYNSPSGITINDGSITITPKSSSVRAGEYHLYIICNKGE